MLELRKKKTSLPRCPSLPISHAGIIDVLEAHIPRKQEMIFFFFCIISLLNCVFINSRLDNLEDSFQPFVSQILSCIYDGKHKKELLRLK